MADAIAQVNTKHPDYILMEPGWELIDALNGGTRAMKAAGQKWLPKEDKEPLDRYKVRLSRAVLFNGYRKGIKDLSRRPFSKPVSLTGGNLPEQLLGIKERTDAEGRNLTQFCRQLLEIAINRGLVHILVDYPQQPAATKAEERERQLQPIFTAIDPKNLINWRWEKASNGEKVLTMICIAETETEDDGDFGSKVKQRVRVISRQSDSLYVWQLWGLGGDKEDTWVVIHEGPWTVGKITLATAYLTPTGFMTAEPPMEDLADVNLAHYQTLSDHRNFLRFAMTGLLGAFGFKPEESSTIVWGTNNVAQCENADGRLETVEFGGEATTAGKEHLQHLQELMQALGMQPLIVRQSGNDTATGRAIDEGNGSCDLQSWVRSIEGAVSQAYRYAADWCNVTLPKEFGVDIFDDFGLTLQNAGDKDWLLKVWQAGGISLRTFLTEGKARAGFSETLDVEKEVLAIKREGPATGMVGRENEGDDPLLERMRKLMAEGQGEGDNE